MLDFSSPLGFVGQSFREGFCRRKICQQFGKVSRREGFLRFYSLLNWQVQGCWNFPQGIRHRKSLINGAGGKVRKDRYGKKFFSKKIEILMCS